MKAVHALGVLIIICASCAPAVGASPTSTLVATATVRQATATQQPTETPTPDPYEVTREKLNNQPPDYEYLRSHLDEFVQAPSPWEQGVDEFYQWVYAKLDPILGIPSQRVPNVVIDYVGIGGEDAFLTVGKGFDSVAPIGEIPFFYFLHNDIPYPVYVFNGQRRGKEGTSGTMGVIIIDGWGGIPVTDLIRYVYNGNIPFGSTWIILDSTNYSGYIPDEIAQLIRDTRFGTLPDDAPRRTRIGFGTVHFYPLP